MTFKIAIRKGDLSLFPRGLLAEVSLELGHVKRKKVRDASSLIGQNDDWQTAQLGGIITSDQVTEIQKSQLAPH